MDQTITRPLIIGFVTDLFFIAKIEPVLEALEFDVKWIDAGEIYTKQGLETPYRQLGEHITGPLAGLIDWITQLRPALMIFDLSNAQIPWKQWIGVLKSVPATRRYRVLCYGSHVDKNSLEAAQLAGADIVVPRSQFARQMTHLIKQWAIIPDLGQIEFSCKKPISQLALTGIALFNQGEFFESHEVLEEAWKEEESLSRELYRAILQIAVAYLQIERQNYNGALKMFWRVRQWIDPLPEICRGINVGQLRRDARLVYDALLELGPERLAQFDRSLFQPVLFEPVE